MDLKHTVDDDEEESQLEGRGLIWALSNEAVATQSGCGLIWGLSNEVVCHTEWVWLRASRQACSGAISAFTLSIGAVERACGSGIRAEEGGLPSRTAPKQAGEEDGSLSAWERASWRGSATKPGCRQKVCGSTTADKVLGAVPPPPNSRMVFIIQASVGLP